MKTILAQYRESCENNDGDVICPDCGNELLKWNEEAYKYIESGRCPFCDCDKDVEQEWFDRCDSCPKQQNCENAAADLQHDADEQNLELLRYQCRGY